LLHAKYLFIFIQKIIFYFWHVEKKWPNEISQITAGVFLAGSLFYIIFAVRPVFYFHHVQPSFLASGDFLTAHLNYPGGLSDWAAALWMQSFHHPVLGPVLFAALAGVLFWLSCLILDTISRNRLNRVLALVPVILTVVLCTNYNFPYSVIVSMIFVQLGWLVLGRLGKRLPGQVIIYSLLALFLYYATGSGYMLIFSAGALFLVAGFGSWKNLVPLLYMAGFCLLVPRLAASFVFPVAVDQEYFYFFPPAPYFMAYEPGSIFHIFLWSVPGTILLARILDLFRNSRIPELVLPALLIALAVYGHRATWVGDARKIVACDYFTYAGQPDKAAAAATGLKEYNFAANLNYNLAMSKAGKLTERFFDFFQMAGTDALHPDVEFSSELSFIAADFYYELGYISEARHWAYATLVNYPYSPRALQLLVKIHLVTREYKAAERSLNILRKGLVNRKFLKEYSPMAEDTSRIDSDRELAEKRNCIPGEKELSPFINERFVELLEANPANRLAYEYLMLYFLLDDQLENFMKFYPSAGMYFTSPVEAYEEAVLLYGQQNGIPVEDEYDISPETLERFARFNQTLNRYERDPTMARNVLYWDMGKTYLYYMNFLYPRIIKPEIIRPEYEESPI
jgi:hypothetical protein